MAVSRANFGLMIQTQPQLIARLTTLLAERIWLIYKQLANTQISDPVGRMYDTLQMQLEKKRINIKTESPFVFDFGTRELINMVGLTQGDGSIVVKKLLKNNSLQINNDKIFVTDVREIAKQTAYFRKMQQLERHRKENAASQNKF
jgi:CRP-like cAMP-binding protein